MKRLFTLSFRLVITLTMVALPSSWDLPFGAFTWKRPGRGMAGFG